MPMMDNESQRRINQLVKALSREKATVRAVTEQVAEIMNRFNQHMVKYRALEKWVERAAQRIKYIEDIPGKRIPYLLNFQIELPPSGAASSPPEGIVSIANQRFMDTQTVPMDGPFICTHYMASFMMKTYSLGPTEERPQDVAAGQEVITPLTGRFRPVASTNDDFSGAYIGPGTTPTGAGGEIVNVNTPRPGAIDFLWEIEDQGSVRSRQNQIPQPSRYLFSEVDRPYYCAVSDFYDNGSVIKFTSTPTREADLVEMAYVAYNGVSGGEGADITGANDDRRVFATGGTLWFTMGGYKILQSKTPAV